MESPKTLSRKRTDYFGSVGSSSIYMYSTAVSQIDVIKFDRSITSILISEVHMHILIWEVSPPPAMKQIRHWSDLSVHAYFNYPCRQSVIEDYLYDGLNSCRPLFFPAGHQAMRWIRGSTKRELFRLLSLFAALCLLPCLCQGQLAVTSTFTPLTFCSMQMVLLPAPIIPRLPTYV
jgi:hypothetical protein